VSLSSSFAPFHSVEIYEKIKAKLELNPQLRYRNGTYKKWTEYLAATILLLVGIGFNTISCSKQQSGRMQTTEKVKNGTRTEPTGA
jgi:hypothetical protein